MIDHEYHYNNIFYIFRSPKIERQKTIATENPKGDKSQQC